MAKRKYDRIASKAGKVGEFVADRQTKKSLEFVDRPVIDDKKINVLLMGASGVGKSTLINAMLGEDRAKVGDGSAVTKKMKLYERKDLPFRMIDTVGMEYSILKQEKARRELSGWSEEGLTRKDMTKLIHVIWFCIDAQSKRVFKESLDYLYRISKLWEGVPIVVVFTKSYAAASNEDNEAMFRKVMKRYRKRKKLNVKAIVSVVSKDLPMDKDYTVKAYGLDELASVTEELIPLAKEINETVMENMSYKVRKKAAEKYVDAATRSAFAVAVMPTKRSDGDYLEPIQDTLLERIAEVYRLDEDEKAAMLKSAALAKKLIPLGKAAGRRTRGFQALNGRIASGVTAAIGASAIRSAEKLNKAREKE